MPVELHRSFHQIRTAGLELQQGSEIIYITIVKYMMQTTLKDVPMMYRKHTIFVRKPQLISVGKIILWPFTIFFNILELLFWYIKIINQIALGIRINEITVFLVTMCLCCRKELYFN